MSNLKDKGGVRLPKDLLLYDVDWWILGKTARVLQRYHPDLELMSVAEAERLVESAGAQAINQRYSVISSMCLGIAAWAIFKHIRIDSSAAVSYYYFTRNYETFREWTDPIDPDPEFLRLVLSRIPVIGAMNRRLTAVLQELTPQGSIDFIGHFVDTEHFTPAQSGRGPDQPFVIGWAGDKGKKSKNYHSLYEPIKQHFDRHPGIRFVETSGAYAYEDMPRFYQSIDLLLITSSSEGGGATALEAFACGKPVLSTDVGYIREAAAPELFPLILKTDHPLDFIQAIEGWMHRREELDLFGQKCRKNVEANWSIESGARRWISQMFNRSEVK
ncbi:glycosyltransferase family 4 protein [Paenibacillus ihbetae]|uniref:glycosyltransferase family 4 protein n=1 Tax=Paenibacillus ihbetae TaxID=1870820 RepID=UPI0009846DEA|nr:glycosyltransferase family 4 protein [Paenibacillus ihbetae]